MTATTLRLEPMASSLLALLLSGCYAGHHGAVDSTPMGSAGTGEASDDGTKDPDQEREEIEDEYGELEPAPMRRITRVEYANIVDDVFGLSLPADAKLPADGQAGGFAASRTPVQRVELDRYATVAASIAALAVEKSDWLGCEPAAEGDACLEEFMDGPAARLVRHPLAEDERTLIRELAGQGDDGADGLGLVVEWMLQSPRFLYVLEHGEGGVVDARAIAARLAMFIWRSAPDQELLDLAADDRLLDPDVRASQAERMLADPRAARGVADFYDQWLGLERLELVDKDPEAFPQYDAEVRDALRRDAAQFVDHVVRGEAGTLETLFTAEYASNDPLLASIYGIDPSGVDAQYPVAAPAGQRSGLLTLPSTMALHAGSTRPSVVQRGVFVLEHVLCRELPPVPADVDDVLPPSDPSTSERERLSQHRDDPTCSGCHDQIDPVGFGFSHYNAVGAYVTLDGDDEVDASGQLVGGGDFEDHQELTKLLARSDLAADCHTRQWFRYALSRDEHEVEDAQLEALADALADQGTLEALIVSIAKSPAFRAATVQAVKDEQEQDQGEGEGE